MSRVRVGRHPAGWTAATAGIGVVVGIAALLVVVGLLLATVVQVAVR